MKLSRSNLKKSEHRRLQIRCMKGVPSYFHGGWEKYMSKPVVALSLFMFGVPMFVDLLVNYPLYKSKRYKELMRLTLHSSVCSS